MSVWEDGEELLEVEEERIFSRTCEDLHARGWTEGGVDETRSRISILEHVERAGRRWLKWASNRYDLSGSGARKLDLDNLVFNAVTVGIDFELIKNIRIERDGRTCTRSDRKSVV